MINYFVKAKQVHHLLVLPNFEETTESLLILPLAASSII